MDPNFIQAWTGLAMAQNLSGRYQEAIATARKARSVSGGDTPTVVAELGYACARAGQTQEAQKLMRELEDRKARGAYVDPFVFAFIDAGLDNKPQAIALLNEAFEQRSGMMLWLQAEPKFKPLRTEQGFRELLQKMRFKK